MTSKQHQWVESRNKKQESREGLSRSHRGQKLKAIWWTYVRQMAQFQVPQFIDIEQKIIGGKLTMRQFLIVVAGSGVAFLLFFIVDFFPWLILAVFLAAGIFAI